MEAQEEEEARRQEAAHLHLHTDAPAARLPKAAALLKPLNHTP